MFMSSNLLSLRYFFCSKAANAWCRPVDGNHELNGAGVCPDLWPKRSPTVIMVLFAAYIANICKDPLVNKTASH